MKQSPRRKEKVKDTKVKKGAKKASKVGVKGGNKNNTSTDTTAKVQEETRTEEIEKMKSQPHKAPTSTLPDNTDMPNVEKSKTLPLRREETTVTLQDGKIAVDVYVPDEKSSLKLNDTVRVVNDSNETDKIKPIVKSKTSLGTSTSSSDKHVDKKSKNENYKEKNVINHSEKNKMIKDNKKSGKKSGKSEMKKTGSSKKPKKN